MSIPGDLEILLGNGSDEIIQIILMAVTRHSTVMAPVPTFVMYGMIARFLAMPFRGVALKGDDFSLDQKAMLTAIEVDNPSVIFLAYPNNPTANLFEQGMVDEIIENAPGLVVIDEAYAPFTDKSYLNKLQQWDNVLVMRTVSKMGLAGLRLGYLVGDKAWLSEFDKVRLPYNINVLSQHAVSFALAHHQIFERQALDIRLERDRLLLQLGSINGVKVYASEANFILINLSKAENANAVHLALKEKKILFKNLSPQGGLLLGCLRVTVSSVDENQLFVQAFTEAVAALS